MKLKCNDGIVRRFSISYTDGDRLPDGDRMNGWLEAHCKECGREFGFHDTKILKPRFKAHVCDPERKAKWEEMDVRERAISKFKL